jgi:hypothetical protein
MPTEIIRLLGLEGPNLYGPQPGVYLQVRSDKDRARRLKDAIKDGAQSVGMVIGYLEIESAPAPGGFVISANFTTPTPAIGVALGEYVVEGLNRQEAGDEEWDAEGPLWDLQKRRRAEALPLPALQIAAEAASRGVPSFVRGDGQLQLGYGARSWAFDPAPLKARSSADTLLGDEIGIGPPPFARPAAALEVPWEQVGPIPIIAVAGGAGSTTAATLIAATLHAQRQAAQLATAADFDAARALLADRSAAIAVIGLDPAGIARRGLAFERSAFCAITDLPAELPPGVANRAELARVLGVPMLIADSDGRVVLNADEPELVALSEYAPCPLIYFSAGDSNPTIGFHRAEGGQALFVRDGMVFAAQGAAEQPVAAATLTPAELPGALAGLALLWAMGLTWDQITGQTKG